VEGTENTGHVTTTYGSTPATFSAKNYFNRRIREATGVPSCKTGAADTEMGQDRRKKIGSVRSAG